MLVVSGLHLATVALILTKALPFPYGYYLALIGISAYVLFVVPDNPPVLRAFVMITLMALSILSYRRFSSLTALFFSGSAILTVYPIYVNSYSFWLSFLATLYIVLALREKSYGYIGGSFIVSLSAFTGVSPLLSTFAGISPASVLFTPLISPLVFLYSLLGILSLITAFGFDFVVYAFNFLGGIFLLSVNTLSNFWFALFPTLSIYEAVALTLSGAVGLFLSSQSWVVCLSILAYMLVRAIL